MRALALLAAVTGSGRDTAYCKTCLSHVSRLESRILRMAWLELFLGRDREASQDLVAAAHGMVEIGPPRHDPHELPPHRAAHRQ